MRLVYLPANARWAFVFGSGARLQIVTIDKPDGRRERFFLTRAAAVSSAAENGLSVSRSGNVTTGYPTAWGRG